VRLGDIATVTDSVEDILAKGIFNGKPAVSVVIFRQPGANIIATVDRVRSLLPQLQAEIPAGMDVVIALDRTLTIRASVLDTQKTLILAIILVVLVVFIFLRNVRATLIPSVAVPVSLVGTFGVMYLCGYSIDNLSLMALTIATGFVVDDAIVVVENISRRLEENYPPLEAALIGAQEIGFTVLSISVSLVAVFIPILLMGGIVGRLFREFAVTLSVAIGVSMIISLTTTPMMCAVLLKSAHDEKHGRVFQASERVFQWIIGFYEWTLSWVLRFPAFTMMVNLGTLALTIYLYTIVPKGFFPQQDTGRLSGSLIADQKTSYHAMEQLLIRFSEALSEDPAVDCVVASTGGGQGGTSNNARLFVSLKSVEERKIPIDDVIKRIRERLAKIPGGNLYLQPVLDLRVGGRPGAAQYQYTLQGDNLEDLKKWAPKLLTAMQNIKRKKNRAAQGKRS